MALKDLMAVAKNHTNKVFSLKQCIDEFLYRERLAMAKDDTLERTVRIAEARIERKLAVRKLNRWKNRDVKHRGHYLHPSSLGQCARKTVYSFMGAPSDKGSIGSVMEVGKQIRVFSCGDFFHTRMQVLFVRMGLCSLDDIEVEFAIGDEQGTADAIIRKHDCVVDLKSANDFSYSGRVDDKYEVQLLRYMRALRVSKGMILFENKNDQNLREVNYTYNKSTYAERVEKRLTYLREHIHKQILPKREGESQTRMPCKYCPYSKLCYDGGKEKQWLATRKKQNKLSMEA